MFKKKGLISLKKYIFFLLALHFTKNVYIYILSIYPNKSRLGLKKVSNSQQFQAESGDGPFSAYFFDHQNVNLEVAHHIKARLHETTDVSATHFNRYFCNSFLLTIIIEWSITKVTTTRYKTCSVLQERLLRVDWD